MDGLFDGQGVEWSDFARLKSLQNQQKSLESQRKILEELKKSKEEKAEGPPCPACGLALPGDAAQKKYVKCGRCQSDLTWSVVSKGGPATPQVAKAAAASPSAPEVRKPRPMALHCPHCGGDLPEDARSQRYRKCKNCSGDLHWHDGHVFRDADARASFINRQNNRRARSQENNAEKEAELARRKLLRSQGTLQGQRPANDTKGGLASESIPATTQDGRVPAGSRNGTPPLVITAAAVIALRERTNMTMMECKEALEVCGGDSHTAEIWLAGRKSKR